MTHDTDYPKERVEEREHGVFVPPDEQHVREDGAPTEPAESAEWTEDNSGRSDADRPEAIGTEAIPHPEPATPLDTGTAEDAERAEEMAAEDTRRDRVDDTGAEDEANLRNVDADHMDRHNVDPDDVDSRNVDARNVDARNVDARNVDARNVDVDSMDGDHMDTRNVDPRDVDPNDVDPRHTDAVDVDAVDTDARNVDPNDVYPNDVDHNDVDSRHTDAVDVDVDAVDVDAVDVDAVDVDVDAVDTDGRDTDARDTDARNVDGDVDARDVDGRDVDGRDVDALDVDGRDVDALDVDADSVDGDSVAVGTASVPEQSTAPAAEFWPSGVLDDLRGRWDAVQMRFVDDPSGVAADAKALVGEAVSAIRDAVDRLQARLDEAVSDAGDDTEQLRQRVAHYRDVFDSLLSR